MKIKNDDALYWIPGKDGWATPKYRAYTHVRCGGYFTERGEKHKCVHYSEQYLKNLKNWTSLVRKAIKGKYNE